MGGRKWPAASSFLIPVQSLDIYIYPRFKKMKTSSLRRFPHPLSPSSHPSGGLLSPPFKDRIYPFLGSWRKKFWWKFEGDERCKDKSAPPFSRTFRISISRNHGGEGYSPRIFGLRSVRINIFGIKLKGEYVSSRLESFFESTNQAVGSRMFRTTI